MKKISLAFFASLLVAFVLSSAAYAEDYNINQGLNQASGGGQTSLPLFGSGKVCRDGSGNDIHANQAGVDAISAGGACYWVDHDINGDGKYDSADCSVASNCKAGTVHLEQSIVTRVINILMYIIGIISVVMLIYGGILYAISAGDEKKIVIAKHAIVYAIVGLVFAIIAWSLVNLVAGVLK